MKKIFTFFGLLTISSAVFASPYDLVMRPVDPVLEDGKLVCHATERFSFVSDVSDSTITIDGDSKNTYQADRAEDAALNVKWIGIGEGGTRSITLIEGQKTASFIIFFDISNVDPSTGTPRTYNTYCRFKMP